MNPFTFGAILPTSKLFGGVKRFMELGEIFIRQGHQMVLFTPEGKAPDWFSFSGKVDVIENVNNYSFTALFITEPDFLMDLIRANSKLKIFYHVGPRAKLTGVLKHREIIIFSNSTNMFLYDKKKYKINTFKAIGGVHIREEPKNIENPQNPFIIMCYGRLSRKGKGAHIVVKAAEKLYKKGYPVQLLLFDSPLDQKGANKIKQFSPKVPFEFVVDHPVENNELLFKKANVFVAVEKKGGWSNTAAEAMATGIPLVGSNTGTNDFLVNNVTGLKVWRHSFFVARAIKTLINDVPLQRRLAINGREKIKPFGWEPLAQHILSFVKKNS